MKVRVRLYGTLGQRVPGYQPSQGMEVEVPDGATVKDLLAVLEIPEPPRAAIIMEGRVLKTDDEIRSEAPVNVLQVIGGG